MTFALTNTAENGYDFAMAYSVDFYLHNLRYSFVVKRNRKKPLLSVRVEDRLRNGIATNF